MTLAKLRFLVVDDHDFQRGALARMLERLGAPEVLQAGDGEAALRVLREAVQPVHIVISDLDMPGMDGIEFIRRLGELQPVPAVIVMSALESAVLASVETMAHAYGIPLLGGLAKPLSQRRLQELVSGYGSLSTPPRPAATGAPAPGLEEIRAGLAAGEFEAYFQPKVELAGGRVRGFEALARWRRPHGPPLAPGLFLPLMEAQGLVHELTWAMLRQAAAACCEWRRAGLDLSVSVNLSVTSLADLGVAGRVKATVMQEGLDPRHLTLEVTESATAAHTLGPVLENLARLRLKGFGLSIDDFGTGYSSVQQLGRVAFTELKIDQSFVRSAGTSESSRVILQSSVEMAQRLKLVSVAEGVETRAHWELLREAGCTLAQGYYIARPMPADQVLAWVREWRAP